jgi:phage protein D
MFPPVQTNPAAGSLVRKPFVSALLNGSVSLPALSAEITNAAHFTSDTFRVEFALSAMPPGYGAAYWSDSEGDQVQISIGVQASAQPGPAAAVPSGIVWNQPSPQQQPPGVPFILGQVDTAEIDPIRKCLVLTGRDLSALFIDAKTTEKFQNQTSSQIATMLAARHGLQANVAATKTKVGTYYAVDQVTLTREQSEWDLLIFLAQHEGFDLWVSGNTLNFQPSLDLTKVSPYVILYGDDPQGGGNRFSSALDLKMSRSQTLARDIIVIVRSWNQVKQQAFQATYKRTQANKGQRAGGQAQTYSFTVPNLDHQGALNYAMRKAEEISRMERVINAQLAGDNTLTIRTPIQLVGTGTSFDQKYYPDTIKRSINHDEFRMSVRAKNHSTQSTVIL